MAINISGILMKLIGIIIFAVIIGGIVFGIFCLVRLFTKFKKLNQPKTISYYFGMIICFFVMVASWILNMGWYRVILTWLCFPIIHSIIFLIINSKVLSKYFDSTKLKLYTLLSYITYSLSYAFFPDGGDIGPMYVFFGLIRNNIIVYISYIICFGAFATHIIVTVFQLIAMIKAKKQINSNSN